jgi:hypothetical protein
MWDEGLAVFVHALEEVRVEHDASRTRTDTIRWGSSSQACASGSRSRYLTDLAQRLEERQTVLFLWEMDLEVWEAILAEELEPGLHPLDGWDLLTELDMARVHMDMIDRERATEVT